MTKKIKEKSLISGVGPWGMPVVKRFRNDFESLVNDFFSGLLDDTWNLSVINFDDLQPSVSFPKINVSETDNSYMVEIAVAGFNKDDVNLELKNNCLVMSADKKKEEVDEKPSYLRKEISSRAFKRAIKFSCKIESASANYNDGLIIVNLKKKEKTEENGGIEINIE